ncbi:MAG: 16S rRNA processing protein RimM [Bacteroidetes bacterium]|nr:MAG: 16S rRNA processing protein RimM [Bacteroidota bacterium]
MHCIAHTFRNCFNKPFWGKVLEKEDCFCLGFVSKVTGTAGELVFQFDVDDASRYRELNMVFAEINGGLLPFFIRRIHIKGKSAVVLLEGIDTKDQAAMFVRAGLFLPLAMLPALDEKQFYLHEIGGFEVIDSVFGLVGKATGVLEYPAQRVLQVMRERQEILIPLYPGVVEKVDRDKKQLLVKAPEGLIGLYIDLSAPDA